MKEEMSEWANQHTEHFKLGFVAHRLLLSVHPSQLCYTDAFDLLAIKGINASMTLILVQRTAAACPLEQECQS